MLTVAVAISGLAPVAKVLMILLLLVLAWAMAKQAAKGVERIGYRCSGDPADHQRQWWLERYGERSRAVWVSGTVRRSELVILCWSFWPWNRLILRRDSFASDEEFRQLKFALYGSV